ncbi:MAG: hypothetical protein ACXWG3_13395 [Usitatibacter sp.]
MHVFPLDSRAMQTIQFGDEGQAATRALIARFESLASGAELPAPVRERLRSRLATLASLERRHGGTGPIELEDADELVASILGDLATLRDADLVIGVALWAIRHQVALTAVEGVVNALAERSNAATDKSEISAIFGLMQGVVAHVSDALRADLERSNPERPWRILHVNLAITAIRTEDPAMIDFAFDALDAALPDECAGFYAEALALALAPGIVPAVRDRIEARHRNGYPGPISAG